MNSTTALLAAGEAEDKRKFGISNGSQNHDWRKNRNQATDDTEADEAQEHHGSCSCDICVERSDDGSE